LVTRLLLLCLLMSHMCYCYRVTTPTATVTKHLLE
jgi:hypothetical protein